MTPEEQQLWEAYWADPSITNRNMIVEHYHHYIRQFSVYYSSKFYGIDVDDVIADSIAAVIKDAIPEYDGVARFTGYLFNTVRATVVILLGRQLAKKRGPGWTRSELDDHIPDTVSVVDAAILTERIDCLRELLDTLSDLERDFIMEYFAIGRGRAEAMGRKHHLDGKQVDNRVNRIILKLRNRASAIALADKKKKEELLAQFKKTNAKYQRGMKKKPWQSKRTWLEKKVEHGNSMGGSTGGVQASDGSTAA